VFNKLKTCLEKRGESIDILLLSLLLAATLIFSRPFALPVSAATESKLAEATYESEALFGSSEK